MNDPTSHLVCVRLQISLACAVFVGEHWPSCPPGVLSTVFISKLEKWNLISVYLYWWTRLQISPLCSSHLILCRIQTLTGFIFSSDHVVGECSFKCFSAPRPSFIPQTFFYFLSPVCVCVCVCVPRAILSCTVCGSLVCSFIVSISCHGTIRPFYAHASCSLFFLFFILSLCLRLGTKSTARFTTRLQ